MKPVECIWDGKAELGESPVWVAGDERLYWVDIQKAQLFEYRPGSGEVRSRRYSSRLTSIAPRASGQFVGTFADGFVLLDLPGDKAQRLMTPEKDYPDNRFNDGKLDPDGNFWAGTMNEKAEKPTGALYRLDSRMRLRRVDDGYAISNGPAFSRDGRRLYVADSAAFTVFRLCLDRAGNVREKKVFLQFTKEMGCPDGMTVDSEDCLWVCHWGGGRVTRFSPEGGALCTISLPVSNVTSCCFGGSDLTTLYVTSARQGLDSRALQEQPLAGGLFSCVPGVMGVPSPVFGNP